MKNNLREAIVSQVLTTSKANIVLEVATGVGKTKIALTKMHQLYKPDSKILIVVPRNVLKDNWAEEFRKWGYAEMLHNVTFTTYISLPKYAGKWDIFVADECHHLSERCQEALKSFSISHCLFLSATLKKEHRFFIQSFCKTNVAFIKVNTKRAIDEEVLPDPRIYIMPLALNNTKDNCIYQVRKPKASQKAITVPYKEKWKYRGYKGGLSYTCTSRQYYNEMSSLIDWYKRKNYVPAMKNLWLQKCGERLKWLSEKKIGAVKYLIDLFKDKRMVVFCNTIEQSERLKIPCVNSKVGTDNLDYFNRKLISKIAAVNCLNEGINLVDCQVGIFDAINSSDILQVQKSGKL